MWSNATGPGLFAYTRRLGTQEILVVFNTADSPQTMPACPALYPPGTKLGNLLDQTEMITVDAQGRTPAIPVPGTSAKIFAAQSQLRPLDPVVTRIAPAHDTKGIPTDANIVIHFSAPMDTASVEQAFATTPPIKGTITWTPAHDEMTFAPAGSGFAPQTLVTVGVSDSARDAISRAAFYAGFESRFRCGRALIPRSTKIKRPLPGSVRGSSGAAGLRHRVGTGAD